MNPKLLYFQGKYTDIADIQFSSDIDKAYQIGALYMLGRDEEALALTQDKTWKVETLIIILFFETLSLIRHSEYKAAKTNIKKAYFVHKKSRTNSFYFYQLLSFYFYFSGNYTKSLKFALRTLK